MDQPEWRWPAKVGWNLLFLQGAYGLVSSLLLATIPLRIVSGGDQMPEGKSWDDLKAENPWLPAFLQQFLRLWGVSWLAMSILGLAITWRPFRQEAQWAWFALWVYPVLQVYQATDFLTSTNPQDASFGLGFHLALAVLGFAALALTASRFFRSGPPATGPRPSP